MDNQNQIDKEQFLWKVLGRYDDYIGSTNSKTAIIVAFNAFVVTGIILRWNDIGTLFTGYTKLTSVANLLLIVAAISSTVSLWFVFKSINPFLKSPEHPTKYTSAIFFGHVSKFNSPEDYIAHLNEMDQDRLFQDLARQAHSIAQGTKNKFDHLAKAIGVIILFQIPSLTTILLMKLGVIIHNYL